MVYTSFDELNGKTLEENDTVVFGRLNYTVRPRFLAIQDDGNNEQVFRDLNMEGKVDRLLNEAYGYRNTGGWWPECSIHGDYEALTRAVLVLLAFGEGSDVEVQMPDGTWKMFSREKYMANPRITFPTRKAKVRIKLTTTYDAIVEKDQVQVGCQIIPFEKVEKVYKLMLSLRKK